MIGLGLAGCAMYYILFYVFLIFIILLLEGKNWNRVKRTSIIQLKQI